MKLTTIIPLILSLLCVCAVAQEPSTYYQDIQQSATAPIPAAEFREIELRAYYRVDDKDAYRALSDAYAGTSEPLWAIIYTEVYCNLDHESDTCARLAKRTVDLLTAAVKEDGTNTTFALAHQHNVVASEAEAGRLPLSMNYEMSFAVASAVSGVGSFAPVTLDKLHRIRATQLQLWHEKELSQNDLIKRLFEVEAAGHLEAYDYGLLRPAFPKEFEEWKATHASQYAAWEKWRREHSYTVRSSDFHRIHALVAPAGSNTWSAEEAVAADMFDQAERLVVAKKSAEALPYLDRVLAIFVKEYSDVNTTYLSARDQTESGLYLMEAAVSKTGRSVKVVSGGWSYAYFRKSYVLTELHRSSEAKAFLDRAIALSPWNATYLSERGHLYQQERNWPEALRSFTRAAEAANMTSPAESRQNDLARAWRGSAFAYIEQGRVDEAASLYRKCLDMNPNDQMAQHELKYIERLREKNQSIDRVSK
jgi:tetratricopeptide (TPR) repeat protein